MTVSDLLDPIQQASALLDARNPDPYPSTKELRRVEKYLARALLICQRELRRRKARRLGVVLRYPKLRPLRAAKPRREDLAGIPLR